MSSSSRAIFRSRLIGTEVAHWLFVEGNDHDESRSTAWIHDVGVRVRDGRYREVATHREIVYVEEKGHTCTLSRIARITR